MAQRAGNLTVAGGLSARTLTLAALMRKKIPAPAQGGVLGRGVVHRRGSDGTQALTPYGWRVRIRAISGGLSRVSSLLSGISRLLRQGRLPGC